MQQTSQAIDLLFDAAIGLADWSKGLDALAASLGAVGAAIIPRDPVIIQRGIPTAGALSDVWATYVAQGWHLNDLRGQGAWPLFQSGRAVVLEHDVSTDEQRRRHPYYQEFFAPLGLPWFAGVGFTLEREQWGLSLLRGAGQSPYDRGDVSALGQLRAHLARCAKLSRAFGNATDQRAAGMLETIQGHALALDRQGQVGWLSEGTHAFLGAELKLSGRRLVAADPARNKSLQAKIDIAVGAPTPSAHAPNSSLLISRENGDHFLVEIVRLSRTAGDLFTRTVALVFFRPLDLAKPVNADFLAQTFSLTRSEARVAALMGTGISAVEAARQLGIGHETVRTHLAQVYAKLGVSRQNELAQLLAALKSARP